MCERQSRWPRSNLSKGKLHSKNRSSFRIRLSKKITGYPSGYPVILVEEGGFEPPKSLTADLQSAPFGRSGTLPYYGAGERTWTPDLLITNQLLYQLSYTSTSRRQDSNLRHLGPKPSTLPNWVTPRNIYFMSVLFRSLNWQLNHYTPISQKSQALFIISTFYINIFKF